MKKNFFLLYTNCFPVKGYNRSIICDTQRDQYVFIPNSLYDIIPFFRKYPIDQITQKVEGLDDGTLTTYIEYLIGYNLGFYTDDPGQFPAINESYETPYLIHDCIIELSDTNSKHWIKILDELNKLGCQTLELRSYKHFDIDLLFSLLEKIPQTRIRSIEIVNRHSEQFPLERLKYLVNSNQIVTRYVSHSATFNEHHDALFITDTNLQSNSCCGNISSKYFSVNLQAFLEAKEHNSCLYKKISVDLNGNIKNCPSLETSYGNIATKSLLDAITMHHYKEIAAISKDQIKVCKDCEFRYICSDCRAFLNSPHDKPLKCNYNPYTNEYD